MLNDIYSIIPKLVNAALNEEKDSVEKIAITMSRKLRNNYPELAEKIGEAVANKRVGVNSIRSFELGPKPIDKDSRLDLVNVELYHNIDRPIFNFLINDQIDDFLKERAMKTELLKKGIAPTRSLLLTGPPGVGKTYLATYLSSELGLNLITLDLATTISSYLGKTGRNIRNILDYSRENPCILFLDEFDAIAKKRDDTSDLGELKRIVNVLLKELENWPSYSIIIAATNHPKMLDKAIWRRFDSIIEIGLPNQIERTKILKKSLPNGVKEDYIKVFSKLTDGVSPADLEKLGEKVYRKVIIKEKDITEAIIEELPKIIREEPNLLAEFCKEAKKILGDRITVRELGFLINRSPSTVSYHLNKEGKHGK